MTSRAIAARHTHGKILNLEFNSNICAKFIFSLFSVSLSYTLFFNLNQKKMYNFSILSVIYHLKYFNISGYIGERSCEGWRHSDGAGVVRSCERARRQRCAIRQLGIWTQRLQRGHTPAQVGRLLGHSSAVLRQEETGQIRPMLGLRWSSDD